MDDRYQSGYSVPHIREGEYINKIRQSQERMPGQRSYNVLQLKLKIIILELGGRQRRGKLPVGGLEAETRSCGVVTRFSIGLGL